MSYEDPCTVDLTSIRGMPGRNTMTGMRALVTPFKDRGQWYLSIRMEGDHFVMPLDDARGFAQRVNFAVELAHRERVEARLKELENAWGATRSGAI